jgi:hypothetical protein
MRMVYSKTKSGAPLRKFLVDMVAETWSIQTMEHKRPYLPENFIFDLLIQLGNLRLVPETGMGTHKQPWIEGINKSFCSKYYIHAHQA